MALRECHQVLGAETIWISAPRGQRTMTPNQIKKFTVVFEQSEIPGTVTAHLLEFDLVTQGSSYAEVFESLQRCFDMIHKHDLATGQTRLQAPVEYWPLPGDHTKREFDKASDCPDKDTHADPGIDERDYIAWAEWGEKMLETHKQSCCPTCGFWSIWTPR